MATSLYLDTARLGQMSRGAQLALIDFTRLAGEQAGSLYFDDFLRHGWPDWPDSLRRRYPRLADWQGVAHLKGDLKRLAGAREESRLLLANRTSQLMRLAARLLFGPCRNVLVTDLSWPSYAAILQRQAKRSGNALTSVPVRRAILHKRLTADQLIDRLAETFAVRRCDGLFLPAVDNLGVRLPVEALVREIRRRAELRFVVIDGAQEFCHAPLNLAAGFCDLYIAGCHKWLRAYHPMGLAFYGQHRSQDYIEATLSRLLRSHRIFDPLLSFTEELENGTTTQFGETVNVVSLFSCRGAVSDLLDAGNDIETTFANRLANANVLTEFAHSVSWKSLRPRPGLSSGIVLLQSRDASVRQMQPDALRGQLLRYGVAATAYPEGRMRLAMPSHLLQAGELTLLETALRSIGANSSAEERKRPEDERNVDRLPGRATA